MGRLNLTGLLTWLALAVLVLVLMSFEDPFRMALAAALVASMDPVRRLVLAFAPTDAPSAGHEAAVGDGWPAARRTATFPGR